MLKIKSTHGIESHYFGIMMTYKGTKAKMESYDIFTARYVVKIFIDNGILSIALITIFQNSEVMLMYHVTLKIQDTIMVVFFFFKTNVLFILRSVQIGLC